MRTTRIGAMMVLACGVLAAPADGVLIPRGNGLIYDSVQNVTWLQDANYARSSGADADGRMFLNQANAWVESLTYSGFTDWRLPRNSGQVHEGVLFDSEGELASLFLALGNVSGQPLVKTGPFQNVLTDYWLANSPALPPVPPPPLVFDGYAFSNNGGYEYPTVNLNLAGVWPVRSGDVPFDFIDLVFRLPNIVVQADGVNPIQGTIDVLLDLEGAAEIAPPEVASFNVAFEAAGNPAGIALGPPADPPTGALVPEGNVFADASQLPHVIRYGKDALEPVVAIDDGLLVTVPFTVAANATPGTYPLNFIAGNELTDPDAVPLLIEFVGGSITVLSSTGPIPGDYNHNGRVDAADYVVWRNTLGQTGTGLAADGNGNGSIDAGDYSLWRSRFGSTAGSGAAVLALVPEPATGWIVWMAVAPLAVRRISRRR